MHDRTPDRCLLIQAALFHARGVIPIPDELFDTAPRQLSDEEKSPERLHNLVYALATGRLKAAGKLSQRDNEFLGKFEPLVQYDMPIPELCWKWLAIHWSESVLVVERPRLPSICEFQGRPLIQGRPNYLIICCQSLGITCTKDPRTGAW